MKQVRPDLITLLIVYGATSGMGLLLGLSSGQRPDQWQAQGPQVNDESLWLKLSLTLLVFSSVLFAGAELLYKRRNPQQQLPVHLWFIHTCMWATVGFLHTAHHSNLRPCFECLL